MFPSYNDEIAEKHKESLRRKNPRKDDFKLKPIDTKSLNNKGHTGSYMYYRLSTGMQSRRKELTNGAAH